MGPAGELSDRDAAANELDRQTQALAHLSEAIIASSPSGIAAIDKDRIITQWNPVMEQIHGRNAAEVLGHPLDEILTPEARVQMKALLDSAFNGNTESYVQKRFRKDGSDFTISATLAPIRDASGSICGVVTNMRDVTEELRIRAQAVEAERHLKATSVELQAVIDHSSSAISVRDLDFRYTLGNRAFLQSLGLPLDTQVEGLRDIDIRDPEFIANQRTIDSEVLHGQRITTSDVVAVDGKDREWKVENFPLTDDHGNIYGLVRMATDVTEIKAAQERLELELAWEQYLSRSITEGRLLVYSQPIIDLATGEQHGEELLVRIQGTSGPNDIVEPDDFLPDAERFGLMGIIDEFMFDQAMRLAASGRRCSVNISATSLHDLRLREYVITRLHAAPDAATNLTFEITETAILVDLNEAATFCTTVSECGAGVDLDDFGTGYGNLTELRNLKLNSLKIDTSFVFNVATNEQDQQVVRIVVQMAKDFGLTTIAEGVEDSDAMELLRRLGVDYAQGFLFGKPEPVRHA